LAESLAKAKNLRIDLSFDHCTTADYQALVHFMVPRFLADHLLRKWWQGTDGCLVFRRKTGFFCDEGAKKLVFVGDFDDIAIA
jgi:hypothetical protein